MIRTFDPQDLEAICAIANRAWRGIYRMSRACYGDELFELIVPDEATAKGEQVRRHCARHPDWVVVAEEAGRIVGFATFLLHPQQRIGEIGNNAVDPDCVGRGIAQQLYRAAFERFRQQGMVYAKVQTGRDDAHARARRAYERAGFDIHHEEVTCYRRL